MRLRLLTALLVGVLVLSATGCGGGGGSEDSAFSTNDSGGGTVTGSPAPGAAAGAPRVVGTIASDLEAPWGLAFLPDGSALVTERDSGRVLQVPAAGGTPREVGRIDETQAQGESGLLGLAVSPSYSQDRQVFLYVTTDDDNRVVRATFNGTRLGPVTPILTGIPNGFIHDGGRLAFGPDGYLYVSTGETGDGEIAQDPDSLGGKILRITEDGKPAPGNPKTDSPVWTIGHRNVQGLAFDPDGRLWASEFGASSFDELNLIQKGTNYGWPEVEGRGDQDRYRNPQAVWSTDENSPSGLAYADGHLWMGALRGERLWRITVDGDRVTDPEGFFVGDYGRLRTVVTAPDGSLWITTSNRDGRGTPTANDDRILRVDVSASGSAAGGV